MGIDVMIVSAAEDIASRPSDEMFEWLGSHFEDFEIRYGSIDLSEDDVHELVAKYEEDPVGSMLIEKVVKMRAAGEKPPYGIELMIGS
jgi:hypothetical protein